MNDTPAMAGYNSMSLSHPSETASAGIPIERLYVISSRKNLSSVTRMHPRARTYHHKTRSGCSTCKKRKIKCDEGRPACHHCIKSGNVCGGYDSTPKARMFKPSTSSSSSHNPDTESSPTTNKAQTTIQSSPVSANFSLSPSSPYQTPSSRTAHDFFLHWMRHYTSPRTATNPSLWTQLIPQIAYTYTPIREAIIACGLVGTSILRRDPVASHQEVILTSTESVNRAIGGLLSQSSPTFLMIAAWMFWQLDMMRGNIAGSAVHIQGAFKIAKELPLQRRTDEEGAIKQLILESHAHSDFTRELEDMFPTMLAPQETTASRRRKAVAFLQHSLRQVMVARQNFSDGDLEKPGGEKIWLMLERSKRELTWILRKWAASGSTSAGTNDDSDGMDFSRKKISSVFSPYLESLGTEKFSEQQLEMEFAKVLPVFLLRVAQDDLELRQDMAELLEVVARDREASRPIYGAKVPTRVTE